MEDKVSVFSGNFRYRKHACDLAKNISCTRPLIGCFSWNLQFFDTHNCPASDGISGADVQMSRAHNNIQSLVPTNSELQPFYSSALYFPGCLLWLLWLLSLNYNSHRKLSGQHSSSVSQKLLCQEYNILETDWLTLALVE